MLRPLDAVPHRAGRVPARPYAARIFPRSVFPRVELPASRVLPAPLPPVPEKVFHGQAAIEEV